MHLAMPAAYTLHDRVGEVRSYIGIGIRDYR